MSSMHIVGVLGILVANILGLAAILILITSYKKGKNVMVYTFVSGVIVCIIWATINTISGHSLNWWLYNKVVLVSVLIGVLLQLPVLLKKRG